MSKPDTIHVAYSISGRPGNRTYSAVAATVRDGCKGYISRTIASEDTREAATGRATATLQSDYRRAGLPVPVEIVEHGRLSWLTVNGVYFLPPMAAA